jgi:hypothetical protein
MMDLLSTLTLDMDVEAEQARTVATRVFRFVQEALADSFGVTVAEAFAARMPDLSPAASPELSASADGETALGVDATLLKIVGGGIDPVKAGLALPAIGAYLRGHLSPELFRQVLRVAPFLTMVAPQRHPEWVVASHDRVD